jgi:hypothetical protein
VSVKISFVPQLTPHRSEADEDITALYSSATSHSAYPSPWTGNKNTLIGGMGKITLHHRRWVKSVLVNTDVSQDILQPVSEPLEPRTTKPHPSPPKLIPGDIPKAKRRLVERQEAQDWSRL